MINLEQVKLLESRVVKAIDYVERLVKENGALQTKMETYQKRIDELEVLVTGFKDDQDRIEEGILSALDRLSRFEKAMEKTLRKPAGKAADANAAADAGNSGSGEGQTCFEIPENASEGAAPELDIF
jgi:peptidoglycan hydrolase CwlO-like protein